MRVCQDLPAGFVGIGSEKSVDVAVCDITPFERFPPLFAFCVHRLVCSGPKCHSESPDHD